MQDKSVRLCGNGKVLESAAFEVRKPMECQQTYQGTTKMHVGKLRTRVTQ